MSSGMAEMSPDRHGKPFRRYTRQPCQPISKSIPLISVSSVVDLVAISAPFLPAQSYQFRRGKYRETGCFVRFSGFRRQASDLYCSRVPLLEMDGRTT